MFNKESIQKLKQFIKARVQDEHDADEILQETLISAYQSFPSFGGRSTFFVWMCGIAKHEISDFYRKKKIKTIIFSRLPFLEKLASAALGPEEQLIEVELKKKVRGIFANLGEGYQVVLRLKYLDGLSIFDIAQKLNLTQKAVESRLSRARLAFRLAWVVENENLKRKNEKRQRKIKREGFF